MRAFLSCCLALIVFSVPTARAFGASDGRAAPLISGAKDPADRFVENDNGTVLDKETGLMWFADAKIGGMPVPWQAARRYIEGMNKGAKPNNGYTNWRLPTINDLETLIDRSQSYPALPRRHPFINVQDDFYWSSSTGSDIVEYSWTLDMSTGNRVADYRSYCSFRFFWPVRNTWNAAGVQQGVVMTAGANKHGQMGDGTAVDRPSFMPAAGLNGVVKVAAGVQHAMAVHADGTLWAWGDNSQGQLGSTSPAPESRTPLIVDGLRTVVDAAAGMHHSVAVKADGTVWVWGQNTDGQLGVADLPASRVPVQVKGLSRVVKTAAGMVHTVALKSDGTVWAWGQNGHGQLGTGDTGGSRVPVQVRGLTRVVKIAAGASHSLAVKADGTLWAWGENASGQLGEGSRSEKHLPVQVSGLSGIIDAAAGRDHSLALKADGTVWAWGSNEHSQAGPAVSETLKPFRVEGVSGAKKIAAGMYHSVALLSDGKISLWGRNLEKYGHKAPFSVNYVQDVFDVAAGKHYTLLVSEREIDQ